jgi:ELAV like protein 2/3/4
MLNSCNLLLILVNGMHKPNTSTASISSSSDNECQQTRNNLIVNYIPPEMSELEFGRMFMAFGPVVSVKLVRDMRTNISLGYGFIKFKDQDDAERAVQAMNGLKIGSKDIKVCLLNI